MPAARKPKSRTRRATGKRKRVTEEDASQLLEESVDKAQAAIEALDRLRQEDLNTSAQRLIQELQRTADRVIRQSRKLAESVAQQLGSSEEGPRRPAGRAKAKRPAARKTSSRSSSGRKASSRSSPKRDRPASANLRRAVAEDQQLDAAAKELAALFGRANEVQLVTAIREGKEEDIARVLGVSMDDLRTTVNEIHASAGELAERFPELGSYGS